MLCILMSVSISVLVYGRNGIEACCSKCLGHISSPQQNGYVLVPYKNARSFLED
jgi:hypothetical protein